MKKILKYLTVLTFLFVLELTYVNAESSYYKHVWSYDWNAGTMSGIIDSIDTEDGFLAVGFTNGDNPKANILYFNKKGEYQSEETYPNTKLARIIKENENYYAFGKNETNNTYVVLTLDSKGKIKKSFEYEVSNSIQNAEDDAFYVVSGDSQFFIFDFWYFSEYEYNVIVIDKTFNEEECYDVPGNYWDEEMETLLKPFTDLHQFYMNYAFDWDGATNEDVTDSIPYKDGFLVTRVEFNNKESILWYEKDGEPVWTKELGNVFAKAVIPYEDIIIVSEGSWEDESVEFSIYDSKGTKLENDDIYNYYPKNGKFYPEFFVELENGFMTASTKDGNPLATQIMYFSKPFKVNVKTDGNGEISVVENAFSYNDVTFTIKPKEGYVLGEVKVTDDKGNVVTFTDYTFTMPTADVTIEATFNIEEKKEEVKEETKEETPVKEEPKETIVEEQPNPKTMDIAIVGVSITAIVSIIIFFNQRKKLKFLQ